LTLARTVTAAYGQEILWDFPSPQGTNSALVQGTDGSFYGTSFAGGSNGYGTVFKMTSNGVVTNLASFTGGTNGTQPYGPLVQGSDGDFYGTASHGGSKGLGTVFKITPDGTMTTLLSFTGTNPSDDGGIPTSGLVQGTNGNFYGTTYWGGDPAVGGGNGLGTVFTITPGGVKTTLVLFEGTNGGHPFGGLVQGSDGNFYGTTYWGGNLTLNGGNGFGSVFKMAPDGTLTMLATFDGTHGAHPFDGLVQGNDGSFYGTTYWGGSALNGGNGYGTVFKFTPPSSLNMLVAFTGTNGSHPFGGLVQGNNGKLYGTTLWGGNLSLNGGNGDGTVFEITPDGTLRTLIALAGTNGSLPVAALATGSDTNLYGTTCQGGSGGGGVIYRLNVATPLSIAQQPADLAVPLGANAVFQISATGAEPISYQWRFNGLDRSNATNSVLTIANAQLSDAGSYSVVLANYSGSVTSRVATLSVGGFPPALTPTASFQNSAVDLDNSFSFAPNVSGDAPLSFQWQFNGHNLVRQTNSTLTFIGVQPSDEGDYTLVVSNALGVLTTDPVRLWVTPPVSSFISSNFTSSGLRLPYFYVLPPNYDSTRKYPLLCWFHGSPGDETTIVTGSALAAFPQLKVFASLGRQQTDPGILLWPTRRAGDESWTASYLELILSFLDQVTNILSIDTNRIYIGGGSEGVHAAWDIAAGLPGFFAGGRLMDGWAGSYPASAVAGLPLWIFHSAADANVNVSNSRTMVQNLRQQGSKPIYTEYSVGDHITSIQTGEQTPAAVDWLLAQRQGAASSHGPMISITNRFPGITPTTAATSPNLAGVAEALGQPVSGVTWQNLALNLSGSALGSSYWSALGIPLAVRSVNLLVVTGTTVSWSRVLGGNTTFNDALSLLSSPIVASVSRQNGNLLLNWTGGAPPFQVLVTSNLTGGVWNLIGTNAVPPLTLIPDQPVGFYRITGP
jgi:uncharacterized repeat protein (TIGR03803 family)